MSAWIEIDYDSTNHSCISSCDFSGRWLSSSKRCPNIHASIHKESFMKKVLIISAIAFTVIFFTGCYTEFIAVNHAPYAGKTTENGKDTIVVREKVEVLSRPDNQTCYWTQDFFGRPFLKCVSSIYDRNWYVYNNYPWWYREGSYYYDDAGRCPQYYFYDPSCGCCKYYSSYSSTGSGGAPSTPVAPTSTIRRRTLDSSPPQAAPTPSLNKLPSVSGGTSPTVTVTPVPIIRRSMDTPAPAPSEASKEQQLQKDASDTQTEPSPAVEQTPTVQPSLVPADSSRKNSEPRPLRRRSL